MTFNISDNLDSIKAGDVLFYTTDHFENRLFALGQRLCPSISRAGAKFTHAAVVVEVKGDRVRVAHSYATAVGPHFSDKSIKELVKKCKHVAVASPTATSLNKEASLRRTIVEVASQSTYTYLNNKDEIICPSLTCSYYRLWIRPLADRKILKVSAQKMKIAKGLADFIMAGPRLEKFDKKGNPIRKASFCAEFVHSVLQTALLYEQLSEKDKATFEMGQQDRFNPDLRDALIQMFCIQFNRFFPAVKNDFSLQNSTSFAPGRLYTELAKTSKTSLS